jgi:hypothetical protein
MTNAEIRMTNETPIPNDQADGERPTITDRDFRPWYRIHRSTFVVLVLVGACLVFINIPGDPDSIKSNEFQHGWPYHYFKRVGAAHSFWSFSGTRGMFYLDALLLNAAAALCIVALVACICELWIRQNGCLFRFGIKSLLALTALFAVVMGVGVRDVHRSYRQQQALHELAKLGSVTTYRQVRKYDWLRSLFGADFHGTIYGLELTSTQPIDRLPDLRGLDDVYRISLEMVSVPENIAQLAELRSLKHVGVSLTSIDKDDIPGLTTLTKTPQLGYLYLYGDKFDDDAIFGISPDAEIHMLGIESSKITSKSLTRLSQLNSLEHLSLHASLLQGSDESALARLPRMVYLAFVGNQLTLKDEEKARKLWPHAHVVSGIARNTIVPGGNARATAQAVISIRETQDTGSSFFH